MRQVVLISGKIRNGKSSLARQLADEFNYIIVRTSQVVQDRANEQSPKPTRSALQEMGDRLDQETNFCWIYNEVCRVCSTSDEDVPIVVDSIRNTKQLDCFRKQKNLNIVHVHLYAPDAERQSRFEAGQKAGGRTEVYASAEAIKNPDDIDYFERDADVRINTSRSDSQDTFIRVAARLGLYSTPDVRLVDVLVGSQYGSEGKGHIAAYLANEYDVLLRVGGPNAGHTVSSISGVYTYHQLPSGARDTRAKLLLGPGMTIDVEGLLKEIEDCNVTPSRLFIDPQAMIISAEDKQTEKGIVKTIASTGSGSGAATARRITNRGDSTTKLARDIEALRPYVGESPSYRGSTARQLEIAYRQGKTVLFEGTQGSGLSIYHGQYPKVTSRDTNVAGCLAEAGISPSRIRRIIMVVRPTPIRVANPDGDLGHSSGLLKHETTFEAVAKGAGLDPDEVTQNEKTSTTRRARRVGWFEWEQFRSACFLNAPTDLVLTFADYVDARNRNARRFEQLSQNTIKFIEELERVAQAPVSLINTRFPRTADEVNDLRTVIDRRTWRGTRK